MRLRELQGRKRRELAWYAGGFLLVQLGLSVGLETCWPAARDADFAALERVVRRRQAAAPGRPLVFVLGSSRTQGALCAGRLNDPADAAGPLAINCAMLGGGPMLSQVVLRRLLGAGFRPQAVFLECMPLALSARDGTPLEERYLWGGRYSAAEAARLLPYYAQRYRLWFPWAYARVLPCYKHQLEVHHALGIDLAVDKPSIWDSRDAYGWVPCPLSCPPQEVERLTRKSLDAHATALRQAAVAPGAVQALGDVVNLCRDNDIPAILYAPPESSRFRSYAPAAAESQMQALRDLAARLGVPLIDARAWVDDDGFWDGHHANQKGADQFTERFRREVFRPYLPSPAAGPVARAGNSPGP